MEITLMEPGRMNILMCCYDNKVEWIFHYKQKKTTVKDVNYRSILIIHTSFMRT